MTYENVTLTILLVPIAAKTIFDWVVSRRNGKPNGNGNGHIQKIINCPLNQEEVVQNLRTISETLMLKDESGTPLRFLLPKLFNSMNHTHILLNEICAQLKIRNDREDAR